jgi:hypothetical protein
MAKPALTKKYNGNRYHLFDYGYENIMKAKGEAVRLRKKGYKVRVARTPQGVALYRKIG